VRGDIHKVATAGTLQISLDVIPKLDERLLVCQVPAKGLFDHSQRAPYPLAFLSHPVNSASFFDPSHPTELGRVISAARRVFCSLRSSLRSSLRRSRSRAFRRKTVPQVAYQKLRYQSILHSGALEPGRSLSLLLPRSAHQARSPQSRHCRRPLFFSTQVA
jgi:hypothetical protein